MIDNYIASALLAGVIPRDIIPSVDRMIAREPHLMRKPEDFSPKRIREINSHLEFGDKFSELYNSELELMNSSKGIIHIKDRCIEADKEVMAIIKALTLSSYSRSDTKRLAVSSLIDKVIDTCKTLPVITLNDLQVITKKTGDYFQDQIITKIKGIIDEKA